MAKRVIPFGDDPADKIVAAFLVAKGIDPKDITGYSLRRGLEDVGTLVIEMPYLPEKES